jgi:hypothetical protein
MQPGSQAAALVIASRARPMRSPIAKRAAYPLGRLILGAAGLVFVMSMMA